MPTPTLRQRGAVLAAVALGTIGVFGAVLLPTSAAPGGLLSASPRGEGAHDAEFKVAGDGSLPETAPRLRAPHEPLSSAELGYALHLARDAMPADSQDVLGESGGEVITADLPPLAERTSARLVTVAIYDYTSDRLHQLLVDLTHREVLNDQSVRGLQLPPTAAEATIALDLAMKADPEPAFVAEYRRTTGNPLLTSAQVHVVAGVWRPVIPSAADEQATAACGQHRCLQLLIAVPSGQYLGTQDFAVDLSTRSVLSVSGVRR
jgi:hypothetical protein